MITNGPQPIIFTPEDNAKFKPLFLRMITKNESARVTSDQVRAHLGPQEYSRFTVYFNAGVEKLRQQASQEIAKCDEEIRDGENRIAESRELHVQNAINNLKNS